MDALEPIVVRARDGDSDAFATLVRRFQDMAAGYGYSMLRDGYLAEDAAQEAFFEAYRTLRDLRKPAAFPGWFRRIVFKQCDRILRRNKIATIPLDSGNEPHAAIRTNEMKDDVLEAVNNLPEHERIATLLFYMSGYTMDEVAEFLEVPVSTVKGRLHSARNRLREMLLETVEETLRSKRPSRTEVFASSVVELLKAARAGDVARVKALFETDPRLLVARDPLGNTALIIAVNSGHRELAQLLNDAGVEPGFHEAAAIGDTDRIRKSLESEPTLLDSCSPEGFPALGLAAHFGHVETVRFLLDGGADINRVSKHTLGVTPLHAALFGASLYGSTESALLLIERGADVNVRRGGEGWPRAGWTPLDYAKHYEFKELIKPLLDRGAE